MGGDDVLASLEQVKALVPDSIFKRAKELASFHKLYSISFEGSGLHKSVASCTGSNPGDSYNLSIIIDAEAPSKPLCQCTCPAAPKAKGNLCKHVIALLLLRTKELEKTAKEQANAAEFKSAEASVDRDKDKEPTLSDSQATELFVPSEEGPKPLDDEINATASSASPAIRKHQKRVLPSWVCGGLGASEKTVRRNGNNEDSLEEDEDGACNPLKGGKGRSKPSNKRGTMGTKKSASQKCKVEQDDPEDGPQAPRQQVGLMSREVKGSRKRAMDDQRVTKRRRTRGYIESDLSEEGEPEIDNYRDVKEALALTTEDLVSLAKEHLETQKNMSDPVGRSQEGANTGEALPDAAMSKKKGSIFSVKGWNEISSKGLGSEGTLLSQETSEMPVLPLTFLTELDKRYSQTDSGEPGPSTLLAVDAHDGSGHGKGSDNIVDDMLGLLFGPTLGKAAVNSSSTAKSEHMMVVSDALTTSSVGNPPETIPDGVPPISAVCSGPIPPKKKGSLKDKVKMYLG